MISQRNPSNLENLEAKKVVAPMNGRVPGTKVKIPLQGKTLDPIGRVGKYVLVRITGTRKVALLSEKIFNNDKKTSKAYCGC